MRRFFALLIYSILLITVGACKKDKKEDANACLPGVPTIRTIINKQATVKVTATVAASGVYLVEEGSIDSKLIPCNLSPEYYQNDLKVIISGEVKATTTAAWNPCCIENFVITRITK